MDAQDFFCPVSEKASQAGLKDTKQVLVKEVINVPVNSLDDFVVKHNIKKIDFTKVDVEGGEYDVFKGAERVLSELRPIILFEALDFNTEPSGYRVFEELQYLEKSGYVVKQAGFSYNLIATPKITTKMADNLVIANYI